MHVGNKLVAPLTPAHVLATTKLAAVREQPSSSLLSRKRERLSCSLGCCEM